MLNAIFGHPGRGPMGAKSTKPIERRRRKRRVRAHDRRLAAEPLEHRNLLATIINLGTLGSGGYELNSAVFQDVTGYSVSEAGDINRDGFDDLLIGAPVDDDFIAGNGTAYAVFGKPTGSTNINLLTLDGTNGAPFPGIALGDRAGFSVSDAGDVNGDGFHDILIGAPGADRMTEGGPIFGAGQAYVVFGGFESIPSLASLDGDNGFLIQGNGPFDRAGWSVSSAGDVNTDGYDDILVSAPVALDFPAGTGQAYLIYGKANGFAPTLNVTQLDGINGFALIGLDAEDHAGWSVSEAGDLNGDGYGDFVLGAPFADRPVSGGPLFGTGETYVVFGGFEQRPNLLSLNGTNGFRLDGLGAFDRSGFSVSEAGDINGDGFDDLIVGAPADLDFPVTPGQSYVVYGKATAFDPVMNLGALNGTDGFGIIGIDGEDHAGFAVSRAGDVNGDGYDDLMIGAPFADENTGGLNQLGVGETYVVFGKPTAFSSPLVLGSLGNDEGLILVGQAGFDRSGWSASAAGDVNGDGFDDMVIGAPVDIDFSGRSGRGYVVFGQDFNGVDPQLGDDDDNALTGDTTANVIIGAQGNDMLIGAGGADVLRGGQGDDYLAIADMTFHDLVGGRGFDTVSLDGSGLSLDLTAIPDNRMTGIEQIDITGTGNNELIIGNVREVLNLSDTSNRLTVRLDSGDTVDIGDGWIEVAPRTVDGEHFRVFRQGAAELLLLNLPPKLDLNGDNETGAGFMTSFVEDGAPASVADADATVMDEGTIVSLIATITNLLDGAAESLSATVTGTGIQASYDTDAGVLTLTGEATAATYQNVLRSLTYHNASQRPSVIDRIVDVVVNDALDDSNTATATIEVVAVNDAPVVTGVPSALPSIDEDVTDPAGASIATVVGNGAISDPDGVAVSAIAVTDVDNSDGAWQYSVDGGAFMDFGTPSRSESRLLGPNDEIRFVPDPDFNGTVSISFAAWDQTTDAAGDVVDTTVNGGTTAFSISTGEASIEVIPVNDAPMLDPAFTPSLTTIARDNTDPRGDLVFFVIPDGAIQDIDGPQEGMAVIDVDDKNGEWQQSPDGVNWTKIVATEDTAQLLSLGHRLRFVPDIGFHGTSTLQFRAWDGSSGVAGSFADTTVNGGTTAFSTATDIAEITVTEDDAPPTIDPLETLLILAPDVSSHDIALEGISDGGSGIETLTISATSSDTSVLPDPTVVYTSPDTTGQLTLNPVSGAGGWSIVDVTVSEDDGDSVTRTFAVSVGLNPKVWQNPFRPNDVSFDGFVVPRDVLLIINEINDPQIAAPDGRLPVPPPPGMPPSFFDVNGDGFATPIDVLKLVNALNDGAGGEGEGAFPFADIDLPRKSDSPKQTPAAEPGWIRIGDSTSEDPTAIWPAQPATSSDHDSDRDTYFASLAEDEASEELVDAMTDQLLGRRR